MKQVTVEVKDDKYRFFIELMKSLDFVHIQEKTGSSPKDETLRHVIRGMHEAKLASKGKAKSRPARKFLNEL